MGEERREEEELLPAEAMHSDLPNYDRRRRFGRVAFLESKRVKQFYSKSRHKYLGTEKISIEKKKSGHRMKMSADHIPWYPMRNK